MVKSERFRGASRGTLVACLLILGGSRAASADTAPTSGTSPADPAVVPQGNFLSSLTQAFKQDFDHAVVRGRFDVDTHRYYCLIDTKTGKRPPNGVSGETSVRKDGMTGIKVAAVSLYACDSAEQQGILVTNDYVLSAGIPMVAAPGKAAATPAAVPTPTLTTSAATASAPAVASQPVTPPPGSAAGKIDVAGVRLGMSPDEVRGVLRAKRLLNYLESSETLGRGGETAAASALRFVNVMAAWTAASVTYSAGADAESYQVMFTPVPGRERVMAIIHTQVLSSADAVSATALDAGLLKKYGGYAAGSALPAAPTWRVQETGEVMAGDACERRGVVGGLSEVYTGGAIRPNLALTTTPEEFRAQIDRCGIAIVTADRTLDAERHVTRFTVTAYAPAVAFEGAALASPLMQSAGGARAPAATGPVAPTL